MTELSIRAPIKARGLLPLALLAGLLAALGLGGIWRRSAESPPEIVLPPAHALPSDAAAAAGAIRFLERRVKIDPDNFIAQNQLSGYLLQRLRETGDHRFLTPALQAAKASLKAVAQQQNSGGLSALARVELAGHQFQSASVHARTLIALAPTKSGPHALLGDALLELGDYSGASGEFARAQAFGADGVEVETRQARMDVLQGRPAEARPHFVRALALALDWPVIPRETVTWCYWQMGETAFSIGDLATAEHDYREALTVNAEDYRAQVGLSRILAARGDSSGAISLLNQAVRSLPETTFLAMLGDFYHLSGRQREAKGIYQLTELSASPAKATTPSARLHARLHSRQLAVFYADHDLHSAEAYALAKKDYVERRDIYGADTLAWTALKAGHPREAQIAMTAARRLGTQDARLFYHAGLIAKANGSPNQAKEFLQQALTLNPHFDELQASVARRVLDELSR